MSQPQPTQPSTQVSDARRSLPEKYVSTPLKCHGFLLRCSHYFTYQTGAPTTKRSDIATVISLLTGRALEWATAVWEGERRSSVTIRDSWLCSGWSSSFLQRAERELSDFSSSSRVFSPLWSMPSPFGPFQPPAARMSQRSALYPGEDCANISRRRRRVGMTTYPWTHSLLWLSVWITFFTSPLASLLWLSCCRA